MPPELKSNIVFLTDFSQYKLIWLREASQYKRYKILDFCFTVFIGWLPLELSSYSFKISLKVYQTLIANVLTQ